jgi:hypothetical protein
MRTYCGFRIFDFGQNHRDGEGVVTWRQKTYEGSQSSHRHIRVRKSSCEVGVMEIEENGARVQVVLKFLILSSRCRRKRHKRNIFLMFFIRLSSPGAHLSLL